MIGDIVSGNCSRIFYSASVAAVFAAKDIDNFSFFFSKISCRTSCRYGLNCIRSRDQRFEFCEKFCEFLTIVVNPKPRFSDEVSVIVGDFKVVGGMFSENLGSHFKQRPRTCRGGNMFSLGKFSYRQPTVFLSPNRMIFGYIEMFNLSFSYSQNDVQQLFVRGDICMSNGLSRILTCLVVP
jgi:hypothetical protein